MINARQDNHIGAAVCGILVGVLSAVLPIASGLAGSLSFGRLLIASVWRAFLFAILSTASAIVTEMRLP